MNKKLTRHQLAYKLLQEQPHLRFGTPEFRKAFIVRSIYQVGSDASALANFTGYSRKYVSEITAIYNKHAIKALRAFLNGQTAPKKSRAAKLVDGLNNIASRFKFSLRRNKKG